MCLSNGVLEAFPCVHTSTIQSHWTGGELLPRVSPPKRQNGDVLLRFATLCHNELKSSDDKGLVLLLVIYQQHGRGSGGV